ncbi:MAG TPA: histidine kinase dimerization/phospho-acceptor domain-containing protein [Pyrinomonadaceae bacterium]|nr:histidine kinase dimerization/phospho-acceptor domain-containing protein [Pyrinomonadaceae bacterium]
MKGVSPTFAPYLAARRTELTVKGGIHIPHNRVQRDEGVLRKNEVAPDFARQMGHEIRTPLNVIIGLCQYLERDRVTPLTSEQRESLVRMERNALALLDSVNHLLECVRTGKYE